MLGKLCTGLVRRVASPTVQMLGAACSQWSIPLANAATTQMPVRGATRTGRGLGELVASLRGLSISTYRLRLAPITGPREIECPDKRRSFRETSVTQFRGWSQKLAEARSRPRYLCRASLAALILGPLALAACQKAAQDAQPAADSQGTPVATIDGKPISGELFDAYAKVRARKSASELTDAQRKELLEQLIHLELTAGSALKAGLDKQAETAARLEISRLNVLADAALEEHLKGKEPTEQELRAEYETQVAAMSKVEYRARHILVATEPFAQSVIEKLRKGADFAALAGKESMDSKNSGGELGWFSPTSMVPEFAAAVAKLKKGEITQTPVQTQYGWHVIQLEDTREVTAPDFEEVKARLSQLVRQKKLQAYMEELKSTAKIDVTT